MKKLIIIFLLFAGLAVPAAAQVWETSAESSRSEHRLQMNGGASQWSVMPLSSHSLRSSASSQRSLSGNGLTAIGAGAPSAALSASQLPQVQFGRGTVSSSDLVSDPTVAPARRYLAGENEHHDDVHDDPIGDIPWLLLIGLAAMMGFSKGWQKRRQQSRILR